MERKLKIQSRDADNHPSKENLNRKIGEEINIEESESENRRGDEY